VSARRLASSSFWWINQGRACDWESAGGFVYAGKYTSNGSVVQHHSDLLKLVPGNGTLHAARGFLRAVGRVTGTAVAGTYTPPGRNPEEGWRVPVSYRELLRPVLIKSSRRTSGRSRHSTATGLCVRGIAIRSQPKMLWHSSSTSATCRLPICLLSRSGIPFGQSEVARMFTLVLHARWTSLTSVAPRSTAR
jgi:hypothetical protein